MMMKTRRIRHQFFAHGSRNYRNNELTPLNRFNMPEKGTADRSRTVEDVKGDPPQNRTLLPRS